MHMSLHKENFAFLLLTKRIEFEHLNQTRRGFINDGDFKLQRKQLHTYVEVAEDIINELSDLFFFRFDYVVKPLQQLVVDVKQ
jgi:hypothetical protein